MARWTSASRFTPCCTASTAPSTGTRSEAVVFDCVFAARNIVTLLCRDLADLPRHLTFRNKVKSLRALRSL